MSHSPDRFNAGRDADRASRTCRREVYDPARLRGVPVAWALLFPAHMITDTRSWRRLTSETISDLPEAGAVFEVANLVRTVQFIGTASGNLRSRLATYVQQDLKARPIPR